MGAPLRRSKKKITFVVLVTIFLSITIVLLLFFVTKSIKKQRFNNAIQSSEQKYKESAFAEMLPFLQIAVDNCGDVSEAERTVKAIFQFAEAESDYEAAFRLCSRLSDSYPHNEDLAAFTVQAGLLNGSIRKSFPIASERLNSLIYQDLLLESFLRSQESSYTNSLIEKHPLISINKNGSSDKFVKAYLEYRDKRLLLNAVMLLVRESRYQDALMLIREYSLDTAYPELYAELLYDSGSFAESRKALARLSAERILSPEIMLFQADLFLLEGNIKEAELFYEQLIYTDPEFSANPFINLAYIREIDIEILEMGLQYHPHSEKLNAALIKSYMLIGEENKAKELMEKPYAYQSPELALLRKKLLEKPQPIERYETSLWKLLTDHPENTAIAEYLAWFLASREDLEGLRRLIKQSERIETEESGRAPWWRLFYSSWLNALEGNVQKALLGFAELVEDFKPDKLQYSDDIPVKEAELNHKLLSNLTIRD